MKSFLSTTMIWLMAMSTIWMLPLCANNDAYGQPGTEVKYPWPGEKKPDLWLFGGQSNMAGYAHVVREIEPDPEVLFFSNTNEWIVAEYPLEPHFFPHGDPHGWVPDYTRLPVGGVGSPLFFAKHFRKYLDRPIGIIGVATGRSMEKVWNPDLADEGQTYLYGDMVQRVIDAGGYGNLKGMVWYQGESDAVEFPEDSYKYKENLLKFVDRIRQDTGNPNLPIIHVQIGRLVPNCKPGLPGKTSQGAHYENLYQTYSDAWDRVQEAQRQLADLRENVYMVSAIDLYPLVDPIHLGFEAYERLGPRLAEIALRKVFYLPAHASPIHLESVRIIDTVEPHTGQVIPGVATIEVRFSGVNGRLQAPGRPSGFSLDFPEMTDEMAIGTFPIIYRIDFDPNDPSVVLCRSTGPIAEAYAPVHLYYGKGLNPYCNVVDDKDIPIPAFGPIELQLSSE